MLMQSDPVATQTVPFPAHDAPTPEDLFKAHVVERKRAIVAEFRERHPAAWQAMQTRLVERRAAAKAAKAAGTDFVRDVISLWLAGRSPAEIAASVCKSVNAMLVAARARGIALPFHTTARQVVLWLTPERSAALDRMARDGRRTREQALADLLAWALDEDAKPARRELRIARGRT